MRKEIIIFSIVLSQLFITCASMPTTSDELAEDAWDFMEKGDDKKALRCLDKAIEMDSTKEYFFVLRGITHGFLKNQKSEISDYLKAVKLNPEYAAANFNLGICYWVEGEVDSAIVYYNKSLNNKTLKNTNVIFEERKFSFTPVKDQLIPSNDKIHHFRGLAYFDKKDDDNALLDFSSSLNAKYNVGEANYYLGCIYISKKNKHLACEHLTAAKDEGYNGYEDAEELLESIGCK